MKYLIAVVVLIFALPVFAADTAVNSEKEKFKVVPLLDGFEHPWSLAFLPGGDMLVTERDGMLNLIRKDFMKREYVIGLPTITAGGQGGLLDVLVHPDFIENRVIFLSYSAQDVDGNLGTEVYRGVLNGTRLEKGKVIFRAQPKTP